MNKVLLIGRLTADPEIRYGKNGTCIATFTVAVYRTPDETDFIRCRALGKTAEFVESGDFVKGKRVGVEGSWQTGSYENKNKETVYTNDCLVSRIEYADGKEEEKSKGGRRR